MKLAKRLLTFVTIVIGFCFSMAATYKIRYYRVLLYKIGLRTIHLVAIYALIMLIGLIVYICLKGRKVKGVTLISLICISIVYALGMMSLVEFYKDSNVNSMSIENACGIKNSKKSNIEVCQLMEDNTLKVTFKRGETCNRTFKTKVLFIKDEDLNHIEANVYEKQKINTGKSNCALVGFASDLKHGDDLFRNEVINQLSIYYLIDDSAYHVQTRFKDNLLSRYFARADMTEMFFINCTTLFAIFMILLLVLLILVINENKISKRIDKYFDKIPLEDILEKNMSYKSVYDPLNKNIVVFKKEMFYRVISDFEKEMGWDKDDHNSMKRFFDSLKNEKNRIIYNADSGKWNIDEEILKEMGARRASKYKVKLSKDTGNRFFDEFIVDYDYCISEIYPKSK